MTPTHRKEGLVVARLNAKIHQQREELAHLQFVVKQLKAALNKEGSRK